MDFADVIRKRYSVRKYEGTPLTPSQMDSILMAGNIAPTAKDVQPQRIYAIESREAMGRLAEAIGSMTYGAPNAFIICADMDEAFVSSLDGRCFAETDATIVTAHMMLAAADIGIGTCWIGYFDPEKVRKAFDIPENERIYHTLIAGVPAEDSVPGPMHAKRKQLTSTVRIL
ncbi:MAG: nitroreductase family protein [Candidatus Methanomethylophilaceae archaeon]